MEQRIAELAAHLASALIAVDYDGTLAPIVADPKQAFPAPGAVAALRRLAGRGARVAVVTGRPAEVAVELGGLAAVPDVTVLGLYGAEEWTAGGLRTLPPQPAIEAAAARLPALLAMTDPAVWVEDKRLSVVVHSRNAADPGAALELIRPGVAALAAELGLEVHPGRAVLELRLPGYDKGGALSRLVAETRPSHLLYAGDDLGDLPAFAAARAAGVAALVVGIASAEAPDVAAAADLVLPDPAALVALLDRVGQLALD